MIVKRLRRRNQGQAMVLIAVAFIGLLLMLGLVVDFGQIFIAKGYLRKAADAASLAAAAQFREGRTPEEMEAAAKEAIRLNGLDPTEVIVQTCSTAPGDPELCPPAGAMPKKLVRVSVRLEYPLTFMTLANFYSVELHEYSISEAASMDVILVIDISESMAWDNIMLNASDPLHGPYDADPTVCNLDNSCEPFKQVKEAAQQFADEILNKSVLDEEDRLAIVTFSNGWNYGGQDGTRVVMDWSSDNSVATANINNLKVFEPDHDCLLGDEGDPTSYLNISEVHIGPCNRYTRWDGADPSTRHYSKSGCELAQLNEDNLPGSGLPFEHSISACDTTNIGEGLYDAGNLLGSSGRKESLWVVVLLTDGVANATDYREGQVIGNEETDIKNLGLPMGYCPNGTWTSNGHYCQDDDARDYHSPSTDPQYDASDFAYSGGLFLACFASNPAPQCYGQRGQGAVVFTIGLGKDITKWTDTNGIPYGANLLRDIAAAGDDGDPATDLCETESAAGRWKTNCGNYFFAEAGADLSRVFELIASRIFTRLTQ